MNFLPNDNSFSELNFEASHVQGSKSELTTLVPFKKSSSRASLDCRLQNAPSVSNWILEYLRDLRGDLSDSKNNQTIRLTIVIIL